MKRPRRECKKSRETKFSHFQCYSELAISLPLHFFFIYAIHTLSFAFLLFFSHYTSNVRIYARDDSRWLEQCAWTTFLPFSSLTTHENHFTHASRHDPHNDIDAKTLYCGTDFTSSLKNIQWNSFFFNKLTSRSDPNERIMRKLWESFSAESCFNRTLEVFVAFHTVRTLPRFAQ